MPTGTPAPLNPVARKLRPQTVADVAVVAAASHGSIELTLLRTDGPVVAAVLAALRCTGGEIESHGADCIVVRHDSPRPGAATLLATPVGAVALPAARVTSRVSIAAPPERVWAELTADDGPVWRPPAMIAVSPEPGPRPCWRVEVDVGPWRLPHHMIESERVAPRCVELHISGKLNAVARYDITPARLGCDVLQRLWFEVAGSPIETAIGGAIVQALANRFATEHLESLRDRAERG
jgi:hypothetical protein